MLFTQTAVTLASAVVISSFVALSLSPMLGSKFLTKKPTKNFIVTKFGNFFKSFSKLYLDTLSYWLNKKKIIISFIIFVIVCSGALYSFTKKELLPKEDRGVYIIIGNTDEGSSFEYTEKRAEEIEKRLIPLLQADGSPYKRLIMRVPGFGTNKNLSLIHI